MDEHLLWGSTAQDFVYWGALTLVAAIVAADFMFFGSKTRPTRILAAVGLVSWVGVVVLRFWLAYERAWNTGQGLL